MNKIVNIKKEPFWKNDPNCVYCGRKTCGMHFGNPASHMKNTLANTREEAVAYHDEWLDGKTSRNRTRTIKMGIRTYVRIKR